MELKGDGLLLRPWCAADEASLVLHANNRKVWRNLTNRFPHPYTAADARDWVDVANRAPEDTRHFAIVVDGAAVGGVGFGRLVDLHTRTAEVGYWLGEAYWGRGLATQALCLITQFAFAYYDFARLQAGVLEWNPASCRVLEKAGYRLEARQRHHVWKDGAICDSWLYVRLRAASASAR